ncbi:MAG TPA: FAD:protein FMN transferase [Anaerolineales bacterium]
MIRTLNFQAMGCQMLAALDTPAENGPARLERVPVWFEAWEQALSRFREDSELNRLNRSAGVDTPVSRALWSVFAAARDAERRSGGLVTPAVLEALLAAGYDRSFAELAGTETAPGEHAPQATVSPEASAVAQAAASAKATASAEAARRPVPAPSSTEAFTAEAGGLSAVRLDPRRRSLRLPPGLRLDFGGVAKGWAAHEAARRLKLYGPALVDAGGDIAISGLQSGGQPWPVGVADPFEPDRDLDVLHLGRCGVATSGRDYRRWQQGGAWKHHIIDPRTGRPAETDLISVTVIAPDVMEAEMAAKRALILGSRAGLAWIEASPTLAALLILDDGRRLDSRRFIRYL